MRKKAEDYIKAEELDTLSGGGMSIVTKAIEEAQKDIIKDVVLLIKNHKLGARDITYMWTIVGAIKKEYEV